jgi:hypothetical protein
VLALVLFELRLMNATPGAILAVMALNSVREDIMTMKRTF